LGFDHFGSQIDSSTIVFLIVDINNDYK